MRTNVLRPFIAVIACLAILAVAVCLVGFGEPNDGKTKGRPCEVHLRRDAAKGDSGSWRDAVVGNLKSINGDWVVVEDDSFETWVPRSMVLYIAFPKHETARAQNVLQPGVVRIDGRPVQGGAIAGPQKR